MLLDWLERERIITKWERTGLTIGLSERNALSKTPGCAPNPRWVFASSIKNGGEKR
jgi:hypothetical protein